MHIFTYKVKVNNNLLATQIIYKVYGKIVDRIDDDYIIKDGTHSFIETPYDDGITVFLVTTTSGVFFLSSEFSYIVGQNPFFTEDTHPLLHMIYTFSNRNYLTINGTSSSNYNMLYKKFTTMCRKYYKCGDNIIYIPTRNSSLFKYTSSKLKFIDTYAGKEICIAMKFTGILNIRKFRLVYGRMLDEYFIDPSTNYVNVLMPYARTILSGVSKVNRKLKGVK